MSPLVTVVIPCYNGAKVVERCLSALERQTYAPLEVLLIDDASTDGTADAVAKHPFVKLLRNETNRGVSFARNRGIEEAKGKYIHFLDVDDEVSSNFYEEMIRHAEETGAEVTACSFVYQHVPEKSQIFRTPRIYTRTMDKLRVTYVCKIGVVWRYLFRTDFVRRHEDLRFPVGRLVEDLPFAVRALFYANKVATAPRAEYLYRYETDSLTESDDPEVRRAFAEGYDLAEEDVKSFLAVHGVRRRPGRDSHLISYFLHKVANRLRGGQTDLTERLRR